MPHILCIFTKFNSRRVESTNSNDYEKNFNFHNLILCEKFITLKVVATKFELLSDICIKLKFFSYIDMATYVTHEKLDRCMAHL